MEDQRVQKDNQLNKMRYKSCMRAPKAESLVRSRKVQVKTDYLVILLHASNTQTTVNFLTYPSIANVSTSMRLLPIQNDLY